jgi:diguanylate cyclase
LNYRNESVEKSAEYLRQALPLMARQTAALHPVSYAIWYEYVSGNNPSLRASIDDYTRDGATLDETTTAELFRKHVAELDEQLVKHVSDGFQKIMSEMTQSASQTSDHVSQFGEALEKWSAEQTQSPSANESSTDALLLQARGMRESVLALKEHLDESRREILQLRKEVNRAREDAIADSLTGLKNRRGFDVALSACLAEAESAEHGPSLLIVDIDHFKRVNDSYGHLSGDRVIRTIAQILKDHVKGRDTAARYGGEEFVILLPDTPLQGACQLAERIRATVEKVRIKRTGSNQALANVTVSLGVASYRDSESAGEFVARADAALYTSKNQGRNRVSIAA